MKAWWLSTAWPWLKENWWVVLLLPVMAIVWAAMRVRPTIIDPMKEADERAMLEAETRAAAKEAEATRLSKELESLRAEHETLRTQFENRLREEVDSLREDPERLRQLMLDTGRR